MAGLFGWNIDALPGINVGNAVRQVFDPGGDYDVLDNTSFNGGARDSKGGIPLLQNTQGQTKPGYDSTGRPISNTKKSSGTFGNDGLDDISATADGGYGGASGASSAATRAAQAFYDGGISNMDALIASLPQREASALSSLMNSYMQAKQRQDVEYGDNQADFTKNTDRVTRDDARKKSMIDSTVRNDQTNLNRLLGARGAGSSSATDVVSRQVAQKGSSERSDASQITADNMDALNTNWQRYDREAKQRTADTETDYSNNQKDIQTEFAKQGIDARQKRMELDTNRAAAGAGDAGAIARAGSTAGEINILQQKINELAARAAGRTITNKDLTMESAEAKAFNDPLNNSTAQNGAANGDDPSTYYDPSVNAKSDDDLLKELFGV